VPLTPPTEADPAVAALQARGYTVVPPWNADAVNVG
jgi:hypothetical protein